MVFFGDNLPHISKEKKTNKGIGFASSRENERKAALFVYPLVSLIILISFKFWTQQWRLSPLPCRPIFFLITPYLLLSILLLPFLTFPLPSHFTSLRSKFMPFLPMLLLSSTLARTLEPLRLHPVTVMPQTLSVFGWPGTAPSPLLN